MSGNVLESRSCSTRSWNGAVVFISISLLLLALIVGCLTFRANRIEIGASLSYSSADLIQTHGYSSSDMLGRTPQELPLLVERLYRGREVALQDESLFHPSSLGGSVRLRTGHEVPAIAPQLANQWEEHAYRTLLYNPYTFSTVAELGKPLQRRDWPTRIVLLPPTEASTAMTRVWVAEIEKRVFFIPSEWLQANLPAPRITLYDRLREPFIVAMLALVGWGVLRWANGQREDYGLTFAGALPVGLMLWSVTYWAGRGLLGRDAVLQDSGSLLSIFLLVSLALGLLSSSFRTQLRRFAFPIAAFAAVTFLLSLSVIRLGTLVPTFDSFRLLNFENSPQDSLLQGFPIALASLNALGISSREGIFLSSLPLLFFSLFALTALMLYRFRQVYSSRKLAVGAGGIILMVTLVLPPMAGLQFVYVNGHVLFSCLLVLLVAHLIEVRFQGTALPHRSGLPLLVFLLSLSICMTRMEGALVLVCLLAVFLLSGVREGTYGTRTLLLAVASAVFLWGFGFALIPSAGGFVSSSQYLLLGLIAVPLGWAGALPDGSFLKRLCDRFGIRLILLGCFVAIYAVHALAPKHMLESTSSFVQNLLSFQGGWGYTWWFVLGIGAVLGFGSYSGSPSTINALQQAGILQVRRLLITFFLVTCTAVIAIGLFRIPYRVNWSDSANRIVFQLLPFLTVWLYLSLGAALHAWESVRQRGKAP